MTQRGLLAACILGSGIVFLDGSVVNVALPALRDDLDAGLSTQQWVVEAYLLTLGALTLIGGSLGDLLGRRSVFTIGLAGFGATSLLCAVAPSGEVLIAARALQGVAGALLVPSSLAIITAAYPDSERAAAIGSWTAWTGIAFVIGPLGGGALIDLVSWRWIFAINLPLVALCLWLVARHIPASLNLRTGCHIDWIGALLCGLGLGGPVFALIEQGRLGWDDPLVWIPGIAGIALFGAFLAWEAREREPMLPLSLFRERNFAAGNASTFAVYGGLGALTLYVTVFLQQVGGYSATAAGMALVPITLLMWAFSSRAGALSARLGPRLFMTAGPLVCAAGALLLAGIGVDADYVTEVLPGALVFGFGLSLTVAPLTATVLAAAPPERAGVASGTNNAISRVASLLAIAVVGAVIAAVYRGAAPPGAPSAALSSGSEAVSDASQEAFAAGMYVSAGLLAAGGLIALAGIRRPVPVTPSVADTSHAEA